MAASNTTTDTMKVKSNDGEVFEINEEIFKQISVINEYYELYKSSGTFDFSRMEPMLLKNVNASLFTKILDFCEQHKNDNNSQVNDADEDDDPSKDSYAPKRSDDISAWDQNFISQFTVQDGTLFDIITAANYLGVKSLMEVGLKTVANMVRGKPASEVREIFTISTN